MANIADTSITADDFVSLLLSFSSMTDEQMQKERRTLARVGIGARVSVILCDGTTKREALPAVLRDISQGGVGIIHTLPWILASGSLFAPVTPGRESTAPCSAPLCAAGRSIIGTSKSARPRS
jgi:hypothetical protein